MKPAYSSFLEWANKGPRRHSSMFLRVDLDVSQKLRINWLCFSFVQTVPVILVVLEPRCFSCFLRDVHSLMALSMIPANLCSRRLGLSVYPGEGG